MVLTDGHENEGMVVFDVCQLVQRQRLHLGKEGGVCMFEAQCTRRRSPFVKAYAVQPKESSALPSHFVSKDIIS